MNVKMLTIKCKSFVQVQNKKGNYDTYFPR